MGKKAFWRSKTFWGAVLSAVVTLWEYVAVPLFGAPHVPRELFGLLNALGITVVVYGRAVATQPLGVRDEPAPLSGPGGPRRL